MKKIITALLLLSLHITHAQDCDTKAANKPSESVRFQDVYTKSIEDAKANISIAKLKPQMAVAENWIKGILKNFTGAKLGYYNWYPFDYSYGFTNDFYKLTGIKGYYVAKMMFFAYYCYDNKGQIYTEVESGSNVSISFNNVFNTHLCSEVGVHTINGKYAFVLFEKSRTEGRIDYYEHIAMGNDYDTIYKSKHDMILIRNSDQPVFLPITRKEYLEQMLKDVDDYKAKEIAFAKQQNTPANEAANKAKFDAELKRIDNSKNYTAEQMAPYRKRFIETWETEKQKYDKRIAQLEAETNEAKIVLQEYLKKPQEWLDHNFKSYYPYSGYNGRGVKQYLDKLDVFPYPEEEQTRTYIAYLNPAYFNKSLTAETPQLILVHVQKISYAHMKKLAPLILKPGAMSPLEALLNPGK